MKEENRILGGHTPEDLPWGSGAWAKSCGWKSQRWEECKVSSRERAKALRWTWPWPYRGKLGPTALKVSCDQAQRLHSQSNSREHTILETQRRAVLAEIQRAEYELGGKWYTNLARKALQLFDPGRGRATEKGQQALRSSRWITFWHGGLREVEAKEKKEPLTKFSIF